MFGFHIYNYSIEFEVFDDSMNDQQLMVAFKFESKFSKFLNNIVYCIVY